MSRSDVTKDFKLKLRDLLEEFIEDIDNEGGIDNQEMLQFTAIESTFDLLEDQVDVLGEMLDKNDERNSILSDLEE